MVEDTPLALCDRRSVAIDEPVPCDKVLEDYVDESFYLKYNPAHKWYWLSQQTRDEITVFVVWDSKKDEEYLGMNSSSNSRTELMYFVGN